MLVSGLRLFGRSCDLLKSSEANHRSALVFIAAASRISLRIHHGQYHCLCYVAVGKHGLPTRWLFCLFVAVVERDVGQRTGDFLADGVVGVLADVLRADEFVPHG